MLLLHAAKMHVCANERSLMVLERENTKKIGYVDTSIHRASVLYCTVYRGDSMTRCNQNSTSSCMAQKDQRGRIKSELNEHGHSGRVLAPVIGRYGVASSDLSPILDLVAREMARKRTAPYNLQHWLFGSRSHVQTEACTQMGSRNRSEMGD